MALKRRNIMMGENTWSKLRKIATKEERSVSDLLRESAITLIENRELKGKKYDPALDKYVEG